MTKTEMDAMLRKCDVQTLITLRNAIEEEKTRRYEISGLLKAINSQLYKLAGLLTVHDSLRCMNNLTGEVMTDMADWDELEDDELHLAPMLEVEIGAARKPRCSGAPADYHECDGCPWD